MTAGAAPGPAVSDPARTVRCMIIDCGSCTVRGQACADCVVTFLTIPVPVSYTHLTLPTKRIV